MPSEPTKSIRIDISISIPADVAAETLEKIEPVIARISSGNAIPPAQIPLLLEQTPNEIEETKKKAEREAHFAEKLNEFKQRRIQVYRTYRRIHADYEKPYDAYRVIAKQIGWPTSLIPNVIAERRKQIRLYLRERRKRIAIEMAFKGKTNKQIAERLGVHSRTAATLLKEARASLIKRVAS